MSLIDEVEASWKTPVMNAAYATYLSKNRGHQVNALEALAKSLKGQIIIPTGTGKTRVQVSYLVGDMIARGDNRGVYVIASHRLLLNKQLMDEYLDLCIKCGIPVNVLYLGSSRIDEKDIYDRYFKYDIHAGTLSTTFTTTGEDIKEFADKTKAQGRHLIIVATYHSFDRLNVLDAIDVCCYDEAHNTISEDFTGNIKAVIAKIAKNFFFTATRKVCTVEGHGMENKAIYGEPLCEVSPRAMIDAGEVVCPMLITIMLDDDQSPNGIVKTNNQVMLVNTVIEAFKRNKEAVKKESVNPDEIGCKLLVSCLNSDELILVQNSEYFQKWCQDNGVKAFSYSTRYGTYSDFEESANRNKVYEQMRGLKDEEDCIMLHIDILSEGIDLPAITGVLLLRHLNEVKLFQTFGRALRLMKVDREALYAGSISTKDRSKWVKPFAYLILPLHFDKMDVSGEDMRRIIKGVVNTYNIPMEQFLPKEVIGVKGGGPHVPKEAHDKKYPLRSVIEELIEEEFMKGLPTDPKENYTVWMKMLTENGGNIDA